MAGVYRSSKRTHFLAVSQTSMSVRDRIWVSLYLSLQALFVLTALGFVEEFTVKAGL